MSANAPAAAFTLSYDIELDDVIEMTQMDARRRKFRRRAVLVLLVYLILVGALTALIVVLNRPSGVGPGAPGWMYVIATLGWLLILLALRAVWRLSPGVLARRIWRSRPGIQGPHSEEISDAGILIISPGPKTVFHPWSDYTSTEETTRAFYIAGGPAHRLALPKRGLPDASRIPELRQFLLLAIPGGGDQAATTD
jgi:hypothetical protein